MWFHQSNPAYSVADGIAKPQYDQQLVALGGEHEYPVMPERSVSLAWFKRPSPAC
jgi:hypothetical protein